jgi:hypothetical protein
MAERHAELAEGEQELAADPEFAERFAEFDQIDLGEPTEDEDSDALDGDEAPDAEESADPAKAPEQKPQQTPDTQPAPTPDQGTQPEQQVEPEAGALRWRADHKDFHIPGSKIEGEFILIPKEHEPHIRSLLSEGVSARGSVRTTISSLQSELEAARFDAQHSTDVLTARALLEAVEQVIDADDGDAFLAMFSKDTWPATKKRLREQAELQQLRARQTAGTPQRGAQEPRGDTNAPPAVPAQQGGSSIHPDVTPFSAVVTDEAALMGDLRPVLRDQLTELRDATPALKALTNDDLDELADVMGVDLATISLAIPGIAARSFSTPGGVIAQGTAVVNTDYLARTVQSFATRRVAARQRATQTQQAAEAARQKNTAAAPAGRPVKAPPAVAAAAPAGSGAESGNTIPLLPKTREQYEAWDRLPFNVKQASIAQGKRAT